MLSYLLFSVLVLVTVGLNTLAQTLLKLGAGSGLLNLYLLLGVLVYGLSTAVYILILGKINLSVAYPTVIGLTVIATTLTGVFFFREKVSPTGWIGIGLMISGISAIAFAKVPQ